MSTVFISYRHENDAHSARVGQLAEKLQTRGIEVVFDVFVARQVSGGAPPHGWTTWSAHAAASTSSVLVIASSGWFAVMQADAEADDAHSTDRFRSGKGAAIEATTVVNRLNRAGSANRFLALGYFDQTTDLADCPPLLDICPMFDLNSDAGIEQLVTWIQRPQSDGPAPGPAVVRQGVPLQFPPAAEQFFGREEPLRDLVERLRDGRNAAVVGAAGMGKTALAAEALSQVVGSRGERLEDSPFPHGIVFLDLYRSHAQLETVWSELADAIGGARFEADRPARLRAIAACRQRRVLVVIEGGEEADGSDGRPTLPQLLDVLDQTDNCRLVLTRLLTQAMPAERILLDERLAPDAAAAVLDLHCGAGELVTGPVRTRVLELLDGHPLGLTWASGLLGIGDQAPQQLVQAWEDEGLASLTDPVDARRSLEWLFGRSVRGLDDADQRVLAAVGLLARAPFPLQAIEAIGGSRESLKRLVQRGLLRLHAPSSRDDSSGAEHDVPSPPTGREGGRRPDEGGSHYEFTHVLGYEFARRKYTAAADLRRGLADWLHGVLAELLTPGHHSDPLPLLPLSLQHATALLRTDHDQQLWRPLANFVLYDGHDRLVSLGRLDLVRTALLAVSAWLEQFPESTAAEPTWQRERSVSLNKLGDLAVPDGNLPEAQRLFGESLRIRERLAESDPGNAAWQRDLSVSLEKLGDLAVSEGNLPEAQRLFGESLRIRERLSESDPGNAAWQRDLSVSLNKLGDQAVSEGNLPEAQRLFGESLRIRERLAESDPGNAAWQRDLSYSLYRLGQLHEQQEQWADALPLLEQSLAVAERLAALAPTNVMFQQDVAASRTAVVRVRNRLGGQ